MTLDIHPEHLIDRVLRGAANDAECSELALHVRACPGCAAEWQLARALREPPRESAQATHAAVDAALATLTREGHLAPAAELPERATAPVAARAWLPWAAALCLFFTGSAAAATLIMAVRSSHGTAAPAEQGAAERSRAKRGKPAAALRAQDAPAPADSTVPAAIAESEPTPEPSPAPHARRAANVPAPKPVQDAAALFAQARAAALQRDYAGAAALYATLEQRFAQSPQAHVSQVVLGRLYLEHLADPRAALAHFDAYLVDAGANRPEALLGRARALRALGRQAEEIATLRQLVEAYPDSLYVTPARERLRATQ